MFSGRRKKKDLEIEVDETAAGAVRSERPRGGDGNVPLIPRWVQILHYVMHAVLLVIIVLLIVAIALVESDARDDGEDGTANKILRAFHLHVDGSVKNTFECADAGPSAAAAAAAAAGDVAGACRANALGFVGHPYSSAATIDGYDRYVDADSFYQINDDGTTWNLEEYKARLEPYCCGVDEGPLKGEPPKIQAFVAGSRAIVYLEQKLDANESVRSYFTTLDCDAEGRVVNRVRYPALDHENTRMDAAKLYYAIARGDEDIERFDELKFSEDFLLSFNMGRRYGAEAVGYLRALMAYAAPLRADTGFTMEPYFYYLQGFASSSVIIKHQLFDADRLLSMGAS